MPTTVTSSIGTSSRDYSTIQAWDDDCPSDLVSDDKIWRGEGYNDSEFAAFTAGSVTQDATRYKELTTATGQSFSDNAGVRTNALRYNVSNGCGIRGTANYSGLLASSGLGKFSGWQVKNDGTGAVAGPPIAGPSECRNLLLDGNTSILGANTTYLAINVLAVSRSAGGLAFLCNSNYGGGTATFIGCAAVRPSDVSSASSTGFHSNAGSAVLISCATFGFATPASASGWNTTDSKNNATDAASGLPGSSNQHSVTYSASTPFTQAASSSSLDWRPISSTSLDGNGFLDATNAPNDISNSARPSSPTIGVWELSPASGGSTFNITPSGTVTPAGALLKSIAHPFTGSSTPTGSLIRSTSKAMTGTVTPAGALTVLRTLVALFTGTITSAGVLAKSISKTVAGSIIPTGALSLVKVVLQLFEGTITSAGTLTRSVGKTVTGTITPVGTLAKAVAVILVGTVTGAGVVLKTITRLLTGSVTPEGALTSIRAVLMEMGGTITSAGSLVRSVSKSLIGSIAATGSLAKSSTKTFAGSVTPTGTLDALRALFVTITGTVTPTGALLRTISATLVGVITPTGTLSKLSARTYGGTITAVGSLAKLVSKFWSGVITLVGTYTGLSGAALIPSTIEVSGTYTPDVEVSGSYASDIEVHGTFP